MAHRLATLLLVLATTGGKAAEEDAVTTIKLGMDINYAPYAFQTDDGQLAGFAVDFAKGLNAQCPNTINIELVKVPWTECWRDEDGGQIGPAIEDGTVDGCMTYIHTHIRDDRAEFSGAMLDDNKAAGLLTLLDEFGNPMVSGMDDLDGKTLIDVEGWAPSADALKYVTNQCTNAKYSTNIHVLSAEVDEKISSNPNDVAMHMLRERKGDAIFMMAETAKYYDECPPNDVLNCTLWDGLGVSHAYVQTGQFGYVKNGTTFAMTKRGSGVRKLLAPCMSAFMTSQQYYRICSKYDIVEKCYKNEYFDEEGRTTYVYDRPTSDQYGTCEDGYCPCSAGVTDEASIMEVDASAEENGEEGSLALPVWAIIVIVSGSIVLIAILAGGYKLYQRRLENKREERQVQDLKRRVISGGNAAAVTGGTTTPRGRRVSHNTNNNNEQQSQTSGTQASGTLDVAETISTGTIAFARGPAI